MTNTEILKAHMKKEDYRRIPVPLRKRPEEDLFAPLIYNLFVENINSHRYTDEQIAYACREYDPRDPSPNDLLKKGDSVKIFDVFGSLSDPYDHISVSTKIVEKVCGPYTNEYEYNTPPNWSILFSDKGVLHNVISIKGLICVMWRTNICWIEKVEGQK